MEIDTTIYTRSYDALDHYNILNRFYVKHKNSNIEMKNISKMSWGTVLTTIYALFTRLALVKA